MSTPVLEVTIESCVENAGEAANPQMMFAKTSPVPKNSGAQTVFPLIVKAMNRAKRFKPPFRKFAMDIALEPKLGYATIGGENGMYLRELNTQRAHVTQMTPNNGQPKSAWDEWIYGQKYLKNNPKGGDNFDGF